MIETNPTENLSIIKIIIGFPNYRTSRKKLVKKKTNFLILQLKGCFLYLISLRSVAILMSDNVKTTHPLERSKPN
jgi:hypothetical protein